MDCLSFSHSQSENTPDCLIKFEQPQQILLGGYVERNMPLSVPSVSSHLCRCQQSVRTSPGQYRSVVWTWASESLMLLNGDNAGPRWAVSKSLWAQVQFTSLQVSHVPFNRTLRHIMQQLQLACNVVIPLTGLETHLGLFIFSGGRAEQLRHIVLHLH